MEEKCDICGKKLSKRQWEISEQINEDNLPCYCDIILRIDRLEQTIQYAINKIDKVSQMDLSNYCDSPEEDLLREMSIIQKELKRRSKKWDIPYNKNGV